MMNRNHIGLPIMLLGLIGCTNGDLKDLQHFVNTEKNQTPEHVQPLPQPTEAPTFEYVADKDPFVAATQNAPTIPQNFTGDGPEQHPSETLEAFPLDSLRMVGSVEKRNVLYGLVKSADGTIHHVRLGHYLGQNYGRITHISHVKIALTEKIQHAEHWEDRKAALALGQ